jgi:hypothetical protein
MNLANMTRWNDTFSGVLVKFSKKYKISNTFINVK